GCLRPAAGCSERDSEALCPGDQRGVRGEDRGGVGGSDAYRVGHIGYNVPVGVHRIDRYCESAPRSLRAGRADLATARAWGGALTRHKYLQLRERAHSDADRRAAATGNRRICYIQIGRASCRERGGIALLVSSV